MRRRSTLAARGFAPSGRHSAAMKALHVRAHWPIENAPGGCREWSKARRLVPIGGVEAQLWRPARSSGFSRQRCCSVSAWRSGRAAHLRGPLPIIGLTGPAACPTMFRRGPALPAMRSSLLTSQLRGMRRPPLLPPRRLMRRRLLPVIVRPVTRPRFRAACINAVSPKAPTSASRDADAQ
jgi:hypothetical protein